MKRGCLSRWLPLFCLCGAALLPLPVLAQPRGKPEPKPTPTDSGTTGATTAGGQPLTEDQIKAQQHFQKAKELYQAGSYREAATELEIARGLDPKAKDLVMNLGIVHEKLAKYDEALGFFKSYLEMEGVTAAERAKVEAIMKRIEGAKREGGVTPQPTTSGTSTSPSSTSSSPTGPGGEPPRGRVDALTITAGSFAVVGLAGGTALGIVALSSRPSDFVTGRDGLYATLQQKTDDAHTMALIADVGFGVGIIAALATAYLYFGRSKDPSATSPTPTTGSAQRVTIVPGILSLRGTF